MANEKSFETSKLVCCRHISYMGITFEERHALDLSRVLETVLRAGKRTSHRTCQVFFPFVFVSEESNVNTLFT